MRTCSTALCSIGKTRRLRGRRITRAVTDTIMSTPEVRELGRCLLAFGLKLAPSRACGDRRISMKTANCRRTSRVTSRWTSRRPSRHPLRPTPHFPMRAPHVEQKTGFHNKTGDARRHPRQALWAGQESPRPHLSQEERASRSLVARRCVCGCHGGGRLFCRTPCREPLPKRWRWRRPPGRCLCPR